MDSPRAVIVSELRRIAAAVDLRTSRAAQIASQIALAGHYRWVGIYDVRWAESKVAIVAWHGPAAPAHPTFPVTQGLTGAAIAQRRTINVADVTADSRYLTAFGSTRSEIIVPVFDGPSGNVVGTIDVESEIIDAFNDDEQHFLEECAQAIQPLWIAA